MADDEPKRRGRPARVAPVETPIVQDVWADEAVVENPTVVTPANNLSEQESGLLTNSEETSVVHAITSRHESPIEEKIHELVAQAAKPVSGWENDIRLAPTDGRRVMVSETGMDRGVLVYWRISKYVDKKNLRYVPKGRWTELLTKTDIEFTPLYWKPYNPEEYWPLSR